MIEVLARQQGSNQPLSSLLVDDHVISSRQLTEILSAEFDIPLVDLRRERPTEDALALIPEALARDLWIIPLRIDGATAQVVVSDPLDAGVRLALTQLPVRSVQVLLAPREDLETALDSSYRVLHSVEEHVRQFEATWAPQATIDLTVALDDPDAPIISLVNRVVAQALRDRASDVHIEPSDTRLRVRFRIDGALKEVLSLPVGMGPGLVSRIKILATMNIVERRRPQDGQFQMTIDGRELDVRVATTATIWGEKAVLRLLDKSKSLMQLSQLGMSDHAHQLYSKIVHKPFGMVICSGPTGSGKTTTLYATLVEISRSELNVMTIEDPVEYVFPQVNQMQINNQADVTFASGLRSILRQDPDIILVGEVRDVETARIAVQSALTGHVVMSSLHATDAASALYRLIDMGIEPFLISSALVGVVGQRLVRRICPSCATPYEPSAQELEWYEYLGGGAKTRFVRGTGCNYCSHTGYRGRVGVYEVMEVTDEIRHLLVSGGTPHEARDVAIKQGMRSLGLEAAWVVETDVTTIDEVIRNVYVP